MLDQAFIVQLTNCLNAIHRIHAYMCCNRPIRLQYHTQKRKVFTEASYGRGGLCWNINSTKNNVYQELYLVESFMSSTRADFITILSRAHSNKPSKRFVFRCLGSVMYKLKSKVKVYLEIYHILYNYDCKKLDPPIALIFRVAFMRLSQYWKVCYFWSVLLQPLQTISFFFTFTKFWKSRSQFSTGGVSRISFTVIVCSLYDSVYWKDFMFF